MEMDDKEAGQAYAAIWVVVIGIALVIGVALGSM